EDDFILPQGVWSAIGKQVEEAGNTIPGVFGRRVPHPILKRFEYTAEAWMLWVSQIAPVVLSNRFEKEEYYAHLAILACCVNECLSFTYPPGFVQDLRQTLASWVEKYERLYYRGRPERVGMCPITLHSMLHVADYIESAGPVWAYWAFGMELFCGKVQRAITGRRNPYPGIDRFLLQCCQWQHLLWKFPQLGNSQAVELNRDHQLMIPQSTLDVSQALRNKLATYLMRKFAVDRDVVQQYLPDELVQWAKVRLPHRGDTLQAAQGTARPAERDMSYIRVSLFLHAPRPEFPKIVRYGQLQHLIDVDIGESRLQLAVIKPCKKEGQPAPPCSAITFKELTAIELVELSALEGVVGRVKDSRERWCVLDRIELHHSAGDAEDEVGL
ncbi:hypothetical protein CALVIDRAFT_491814, partial [Calocera viscosa TUFC12733]